MKLRIPDVNETGDFIHAIKPISIKKTITAVQANLTATINLIPDDVMAPDLNQSTLTKKFRLRQFVLFVNGGTAWTGAFTTVKLQDTHGTPIDFITVAKAGLTGNVVLMPPGTNITLAGPGLVDGGNSGKGLEITFDAGVTAGSNIEIRIEGEILYV